MTDNADTQQTPVLSNAAEALQRAKEINDRVTRQQNYLISLRTRLPILESALARERKAYKEAGDNVARLELEREAAVKHISKLEVWLGKHVGDTGDMVEVVALANRIKRLLSDIERKKRELHRLEAGLPAAE